MAKQFFISKSCIIQNNAILLDENLLFAEEDKSFVDFIKSAYKTLQIDYPKFYKMDSLSKLAFIAAELLLRSEEDASHIAIVLANKSGSLDTDVRYQESIQDESSFYPSPAVFVYTLANICSGEISIRHKMQSENAFFVSEEFDDETICLYTDYLLQSEKAEKVLCGWVELFEDKYKAVLYLVEQTGTNQHNIENIKQLFLK